MKVLVSVICLCISFSVLIAADPLASPKDQQKQNSNVGGKQFHPRYTLVNPQDQQKLNAYAFNQGLSEFDSGNYTKAFQWYTKAAEQGDAGAQFDLGVMYGKGEGVLQDYKQAVKWYTKAAEQGHARAQSNLATMYYAGNGVLQDLVTAYAWANIASAGGAGSKKRDAIASFATPSQIAEGQKLSREMVKANPKLLGN